MKAKDLDKMFDSGKDNNYEMHYEILCGTSSGWST
jgi:hypothetical protein